MGLAIYVAIHPNRLPRQISETGVQNLRVPTADRMSP